jgi:hypothetical protein
MVCQTSTCAARRQQVVVAAQVEQQRAQPVGIADGLGPGGFGGHGAHQPVRGLLAVVGHLDGEHATRGQRVEQARDQLS